MTWAWRCSIAGLTKPIETHPKGYTLRTATDCESVSPHLEAWNTLYRMHINNLRARCDTACAVANVEQDHQLLEERCIGDWNVQPTLQHSCIHLTDSADPETSLGVTIDIRLVLQCRCIAPPLAIFTDQD